MIPTPTIFLLSNSSTTRTSFFLPKTCIALKNDGSVSNDTEMSPDMVVCLRILLIESSFITLIGIAIGIFLGVMQSYIIFKEISKELEGATFSVPIGEVGFLIVITVVASILASVIPANEASKIYPAEALRYE